MEGSTGRAMMGKSSSVNQFAVLLCNQDNVVGKHERLISSVDAFPLLFAYCYYSFNVVIGRMSQYRAMQLKHVILKMCGAFVESSNVPRIERPNVGTLSFFNFFSDVSKTCKFNIAN